ncbi:MAG: hypothetical protein IJ153_10560 [Clostridia bacterium]|nr:hypothetical protein [Clostridia bacterium]
MKRNTLIERLTEIVSALDEGQLEQLLAFANVLTVTREQRDELQEDIERRGQELAELAEAARDLRRAKLSRSEKNIADRIQRGRDLVHADLERRDLKFAELEYLRDVSFGQDAGGLGDPAGLTGDAYYLGFTKGYTAGVLQ